MAKFRIETVVDAATGRISAELYYPDTAQTPIAATKPIYLSHEHAAEMVIRMFEKAFPDQPISTTDKP